MIDLTELDDVIAAIRFNRDAETQHVERDLLWQVFIQKVSDDTALPPEYRDVASKLLSLVDCARWVA